MLENNRFFVLENNRFSVLENNRFSVLENNRCPGARCIDKEEEIEGENHSQKASNGR